MSSQLSRILLPKDTTLVRAYPTAPLHLPLHLQETTEILTGSLMAVEDTIEITLESYNEARLHPLTFASHTAGYTTMTGSKGGSKA